MVPDLVKMNYSIVSIILKCSQDKRITKHAEINEVVKKPTATAGRGCCLVAGSLADDTTGC